MTKQSQSTIVWREMQIHALSRVRATVSARRTACPLTLCAGVCVKAISRSSAGDSMVTFDAVSNER